MPISKITGRCLICKPVFPIYLLLKGCLGFPIQPFFYPKIPGQELQELNTCTTLSFEYNYDTIILIVLESI